MCEKSIRYILQTVIIVCVSSVCGCTTYQSIDSPPEQAPNQIISNELIKNGDYVSIVTIGGKRYKLKVLEVTGDSVLGEEETELEDELLDNNFPEKQVIEIKIVDIRSIEKKEPTLVGGIGGLISIYWMIFILPTLIGMAII